MTEQNKNQPEPFSFQSDPQRNFTNVVLWQMREIQPFIFRPYYAGEPTTYQLSQSLLGILCSFRKEEQEKVFLEEIDTLAVGADINRPYLRAVVTKIWMFLHESYLKDSSGYGGIDPTAEADKL
jgi:hypothetical protein